MSLDVSLTMVQPTEVYSANITHNLNRMAAEAGIYVHLWYPEEIGITKASQLIEPLEKGLALSSLILNGSRLSTLQTAGEPTRISCRGCKST